VGSEAIGINRSVNPYLRDILSQSQALHDVFSNFSADGLASLTKRLKDNDFDHIVITGMGASYNAAYPAYLHLTGQPVPVMLVNAAELLHYSPGLIGKRTLLWINSQSGHSAEIVRLIQHVQSSPLGYLLACVNDTTSPLADAATLYLPIYAGEEATVSTRTYLNMLAVNMLTALILTGGDTITAIAQLEVAARAIESYLSAWQTHTDELDHLLGSVQDLVILGRGASMAAVWNGSLINKEAAKCPYEGMNAADFRHGPLELVSSRLTVIIFEGAERTAGLNRDLALDITRYGGHVLWIAPELDLTLPTLLLPAVSDLARPLVEILPLQMLSLVMAQRKGIEPGIFRYVGKITLQE